MQYVVSSSTVTPNANSDDNIHVTALAVSSTIANPSGSPSDGQIINLRIKDSGVARTIAWGTIYRALGAALPTTTVAGKELYICIVYNTAATKWDVLPSIFES